MREIKFRAWDKRAKKIYYSETEQFDDMLGFRFKHFVEIDDPPIYMEYTGEKDMDGKKMYEGDIVEYISKRGWRDDKKEVDVIKFRNGEFFPRLDKNEYHTYRYTNFKVLGNIYENPKLLDILTARWPEVLFDSSTIRKARKNLTD